MTREEIYKKYIGSELPSRKFYDSIKIPRTLTTLEVEEEEKAGRELFPRFQFPPLETKDDYANFFYNFDAQMHFEELQIQYFLKYKCLEPIVLASLLDDIQAFIDEVEIKDDDSDEVKKRKRALVAKALANNDRFPSEQEEYLRLKHGYYFKGGSYKEILNPLPVQVYAKYVLFRKWLKMPIVNPKSRKPNPLLLKELKDYSKQLKRFKQGLIESSIPLEIIHDKAIEQADFDANKFVRDIKRNIKLWPDKETDFLKDAKENLGSDPNNIFFDECSTKESLLAYYSDFYGKSFDGKYIYDYFYKGYYTKFRYEFLYPISEDGNNAKESSDTDNERPKCKTLEQMFTSADDWEKYVLVLTLCTPKLLEKNKEGYKFVGNQKTERGCVAQWFKDLKLKGIIDKSLDRDEIASILSNNILNYSINGSSIDNQSTVYKRLYDKQLTELLKISISIS